MIANPGELLGVSLEDVLGRLQWDSAWSVETLRRGSSAGSGWVLREYDKGGLATGRMLRWHPGGGHHGRGPYWRATSPELGRSPVIPAARPSDTIDV